MGLGILNKAILRGGLGVAAALLLSTAVLAQDAAGDEGTPSVTGVQNWHDLNPGIAVGEPDPTGGDDQGIAVGEPDPSGDGSEPDPGDDDAGDDSGDDSGDDAGDDMGDGSGDDTGGGDDTTYEPGEGPDVVIDDGLCIGVDCVPEDYPVIVIDDGLCIGVGCTPDEGTEVTDGDGTEVTGDDGSEVTDDTGAEPEVQIYTLDGSVDACIDCNVALADGPVAVRPGKHTKVERSHTAQPKAASGGSEAVLSRTDAMAECLSQHARSTWICEWQNGAGQ